MPLDNSVPLTRAQVPPGDSPKAPRPPLAFTVDQVATIEAFIRVATETPRPLPFIRAVIVGQCPLTETSP